jgi:uncharacterized membrane protein YesL
MNPSPNEPRKTPFNRFLSLLITKILVLIGLNLLFIVTSIPLLTIPASIASMQKVLQQILSGEDQPSVIRAYLSAFKKNFMKASLLGIPVSLIMAGLGYGATFYYLNSTSVWLLWMSVFCVLLILLIDSVALVAFQMVTSVTLPLKILIKNAFILTFSYPKIVLSGAILALGIVGAGVWFFPYSTPLLLLIIFSSSSFVATFITYPLIQKHIIKR